jgi:hypothetical protein
MSDARAGDGRSAGFEEADASGRLLLLELAVDAVAGVR